MFGSLFAVIYHVASFVGGFNCMGMYEPVFLRDFVEICLVDF